jgi:methionyl-tRNA synthetase
MEQSLDELQRMDSEQSSTSAGGQQAKRGASAVADERQSTLTDNPIPPDLPAPGARPAPSPAAPESAGAAPSASTAVSAPPAARIAIDDFMKVELRVAKVLAAERVPKSKRLLKLQVDVGTEQRTLVAGIAEAYEPDALIGRSIVVVFNLQPATLMGVESNGMVLAASPEGGKPILLGFEQPPPPGTRVR